MHHEHQTHCFFWCIAEVELIALLIVCYRFLYQIGYGYILVGSVQSALRRCTRTTGLCSLGSLYDASPVSWHWLPMLGIKTSVSGIGRQNTHYPLSNCAHANSVSDWSWPSGQLERNVCQYRAWGWWDVLGYVICRLTGNSYRVTLGILVSTMYSTVRVFGASL